MNMPTADPPDDPARADPPSLGRYRLTGEIGRGGMGRVLSAFDPEIGREVAIKVLHTSGPASPAEDQDRHARFLTEARVTGQLEHPGVVPVYDAGITPGGQPYLVMKRIAGRPLSQAIQADHPAPSDLSPRRLIEAFVAVCEAVAFAHHRGVVHQDLKPDNVMIGAFGEVLVMDWGLAALTGSGPASGTPGYIAPERLRGGPPHPLADQWSLGALLYALLSGVDAYPQEKIAATLRGSPEDVRLRDPDRDIPDEIADICMRALSPRPADRFPDVAALAEAVRAYLDGRDRRTRAIEQVARADAILPQLQALQARAEALRAEAATRLSGVHPRAPVEEKLTGWALEDESARLDQQAALERVAWEQILRGALNLAPDLHEAHRRLADWYRAEVEAAERRRDSAAAERAVWLLGQHDRGHYRAFLRGTARLTLLTDPPGAEVLLAPLETRGRRLLPGPERSLGLAPILDLPLPPGSYRCRIVAPDRAEVTCPIHLPRAGTWDGAPPGGAPAPVYLPRPDELGPEDRYVPGGWCLLGGDPLALDALTRRAVWVDGFVMRAAPLTNRALLRFLNALVAAGRIGEAERFQPRQTQHPAHPLDGLPSLRRDPDGGFLPPGDAAPEWHDLPACRLDLASARAIAAAEPGGRWRLPDEAEREKAARGVDGRIYPWGDASDPAFANTASSLALPALQPIAAFPLDESPYGVRGLAGNVRDWCDNRWIEAGPAADGERLIRRPAAPDADFISVRGGAWSSNAASSRSATRFGDRPAVRFVTTGVRLVRSLPDLPALSPG